MPGALGGGGGNPNLAGAVYRPGDQSQMDRMYQGLVQNMFGTAQNLPGQYLPLIQQAGSQALGAANTASGYAPWLLDQGLAGSRYLSGLVPGFAGQAGQWLEPAQYSPIYRQMANAAQQQGAASNAAAGVYGPYAANTIDQALNNLQLGWSAQAPQVASGLMQAAGQAGQGGQALGENALQNYLSMTGAPQQAAIAGTLGTMGLPYSLGQQTLGDILPYLNLGQTAALDAGQLGALGFQQNQQQLGNLGGLFGSLLGGGPLGSLLYGGGGGAFGSGQGLFPFLGGLFGGGGGLGAGLGVI
jgi:hypothetical protein